MHKYSITKYWYFHQEFFFFLSLDQAIDEIDETQLDFSNTVLKPGSITFEELSNLVKDANKRLEQTGQKVAVHEDDFFLK